MNIRRKFLIAGLLASVVVLVLAVSAIPFRGSSEQPTTTRIGYLNITASLPLYIAEEKGFFADEGLQIETHQIATSNQLVDGLVAGNLDVVVEASAAPVLAVEMQSPAKLRVFSVSAITKDHPFDILLARKDSPITSIQDLAGKSIGVFPGSTATSLLRKFLVDKGVDVASTTFIPMPPQNHLAALVGGAVDVIHAYEPTISIALSRGGVRQIYGSVYAEMLDRNPQGVAVIATQFIEKQPETAHKVIRALGQAMVFMRENDTEARNILAKRMNLQPEVASRSVFLYMLPHQEIDATIFQRYSDMLTDLGELSGRVNVDDLLYHE